MDDMEEVLAPQLEVVESRANGTRVISLSGELDVGTVPPFAAGMGAAPAHKEPHLVVRLA